MSFPLIPCGLGCQAAEAGVYIGSSGCQPDAHAFQQARHERMLCERGEQRGFDMGMTAHDSDIEIHDLNVPLGEN
jgi:hypothetical protein